MITSHRITLSLRIAVTVATIGYLAACGSNPSNTDSGVDAPDAMVTDATDRTTNDAIADSSSDAAMTDALAADANDSATVTDATDTGTTTDAASDVPTDVTSSDASTSATISIRDFAAYSNCQPGSGRPDPILAFWTVDVSGASSSSATLTSAVLTIRGSSTVTQNLTVDMAIVTLSGGSGSQDQRKTGADANPTSACGELCSGAVATIDLRYSVDGAEVSVTDSIDFSCVY